MERALKWFGDLSERERRMVLIAAAALVLVLLFAVLMPLHRSVATLRQQVDRKRGDLVWLRAAAPQLANLRAAAPPPLHESLVVVVDRSARVLGLGQALTGSQPGGDGSLAVRLENASFDTLVTWLSQLTQQYGVHVDMATVEMSSAPGTVNASLTLSAR